MIFHILFNNELYFLEQFTIEMKIEYKECKEISNGENICLEFLLKWIIQLEN